MTRAFIHVPESVGVHDLSDGGAIRASGDEVYVPELLGVTDTGVTLGPLSLELPSGGGLSIESLSFDPGKDGGGGFFAATAAGVPAVALADEETTRRGALTLAAAILGAATLARSASADTGDEDELVTLRVATLEISDITAPVRLTLVDAVEEVLPPTAEVLIDQENARVGKMSAAGEGVVLRQTEGPVRVYVRDSLGRLDQLLAWVRSYLPSDTSLTYRSSFPDGKLASEFEEDEFVRLTSHPSIIGPMEDADTDRTVVSINDHVVPHADNGGNDIGSWSVLDGTVIYEVGKDPPDAEEYEIRTRLSAWQSIKHEHL